MVEGGLGSISSPPVSGKFAHNFHTSQKLNLLHSAALLPNMGFIEVLIFLPVINLNTVVWPMGP